MKTSIRQFTFFALIALAFTFTTAQAQVRPYRVTDRQVQATLNRIESRTNEFKSEIDRDLNNSNVNGTYREDSINSMVSNFESATNQLRDNFLARRSTSADVDDVLNRAVMINSFMRNNRMSQTAQALWTLIRADLNTLGGYYRARANWVDKVTPTTGGGGWQGGQNSSSATPTQLRMTLDRIRQRSAAFRLSFNTWSSRYNNREVQITPVADIIQNLNDLDTAVNALRPGYGNRNPGSIETVLRAAAPIDSFVASNRTNIDVPSKWNALRGDLNTLAGYYSVNPNWNNSNTNNGNNGGGYPSGQYGNFDSRLTGTYRLNSSLSDNVQDTVEDAINHAQYAASDHDRMHRNLERRLQSPETLSLEKRGQQVTMSAANAQTVILAADGIRKSETSPNGRTVTTSVTATNRDLTINYEGDRVNDYYVTFTPMANGQLKVTRKVYLENQNSTVTVASVYDKTSPTAVWNGGPAYPSNTGGNVAGGFIVPNNTNIIATLDRPLSTRTAADGDRFSMTVNSPSQYNGAVIEGRVFGQRSGVVSGRANMSLSFDTIRMRDGQTYRFAGIVEQVRDMNGNMITVNNEGTVQDKSQTNTTVARAGIGAVLGAIIGAIAGGGSGAAIGAGVGAGAGAGSVILQGRDNLELARGSQFSITATAPANVGQR